MNNILKFRDIVINEVVAVDQKIIEEADRPELSNKIRKLIFFIFREGISRTFHKINSNRNKEVQPIKRKTLLFVSLDNKIFVNFSTQTTLQPEFFVIKNQFYLIPEIFKMEDVEEE
ncbi:MAG: hypothetical protein H0X63_01095, partial [Flavobacteriales bacterium]|nr:hypothetical protein [Flavobacteriales bacterium]